mgnify:CR=1 FL=1
MADRNNTIAGWALAAGIAALGSSILFGKIIHSEVPGEGKQGYVIQGVESGEGGGAAEVPLATLLASADPAKGEATVANPNSAMASSSPTNPPAESTAAAW